MVERVSHFIPRSIPGKGLIAYLYDPKPSAGPVQFSKKSSPHPELGALPHQNQSTEIPQKVACRRQKGRLVMGCGITRTIYIHELVAG